jgi:hypothetical protein
MLWPLVVAIALEPFGFDQAAAQRGGPVVALATDLRPAVGVGAMDREELRLSYSSSQDKA